MKAVSDFRLKEVAEVEDDADLVSVFKQAGVIGEGFEEDDCFVEESIPGQEWVIYGEDWLGITVIGFARLIK